MPKRTTRTPDELKAFKEMIENFDLMKRGDILTWDSVSVYHDARFLYRRARDWEWRITIACTPSMQRGYFARVPGRLAITRSG